MKRFRTVRPTALISLVCTVFALLLNEIVKAEDIGTISTQYTCSCELEYKNYSSYQEDFEYSEYDEADEIRNGDYYYQQKCGCIHSQPVGGIIEPSWSDLLDEQYAGSPYVAELQPEFETQSALALYTWDPADLLTLEDRETLRELAAATDRTSGVRRATLSDYIESLGSEAINLSNRFEEASGLVVPAMADDLAQTAVFIACVRLIERGELESEEALALLSKSLSSRSGSWNRWVDRVTSGIEGNEYEAEDMLGGEDSHEAEDDLAVSNVEPSANPANPMLKAVVLTAAASLERLGDAISGISRQIRELY